VRLVVTRETDLLRAEIDALRAEALGLRVEITTLRGEVEGLKASLDSRMESTALRVLHQRGTEALTSHSDEDPEAALAQENE
jgi:hypothetical protein